MPQWRVWRNFETPALRAFFILLLVILIACLQPAAAQYARPDAVALAADAPTPDSLASLLTKDFTEDRDKVESPAGATRAGAEE
ncbi:MAG: hypothetical protein EOO12_09700 [Chitinophagaceae bacterium]|nr:MAG: hypothetical protein EOO12_09700 [Chitinophagaceae bacterium]